jgi:type IV secretory pathway VirB6-like protein
MKKGYRTNVMIKYALDILRNLILRILTYKYYANNLCLKEILTLLLTQIGAIFLELLPSCQITKAGCPIAIVRPVIVKTA